jgi:hypothetical protein
MIKLKRTLLSLLIFIFISNTVFAGALPNQDFSSDDEDPGDYLCGVGFTIRPERPYTPEEEAIPQVVQETFLAPALLAEPEVAQPPVIPAPAPIAVPVQDFQYYPNPDEVVLPIEQDEDAIPPIVEEAYLAPEILNPVPELPAEYFMPPNHTMPLEVEYVHRTYCQQNLNVFQNNNPHRLPK